MNQTGLKIYFAPMEGITDGILPFYPEIDENGNLPVYTFTEFASGS